MNGRFESRANGVALGKQLCWSVIRRKGIMTLFPKFLNSGIYTRVSGCVKRKTSENSKVLSCFSMGLDGLRLNAQTNKR